MRNVAFRLNAKFWLNDPNPTFEDILLHFENDFPNGVLRLPQEDVLPMPAQPLEFSFVICFLHAQRAGSHIHDWPFFSYPIEPILSIAPDINRRGGLDRDQRMAVRHGQFPEDRCGEDTYFRVFCKVQRGKSKQLKMS